MFNNNIIFFDDFFYIFCGGYTFFFIIIISLLNIIKNPQKNIILYLFGNNQVILENIISFIFVREFIITKEVNFFFDK